MKESLIKIPEEYTYIAAFLTLRCNLSCEFCLNAFDGDFSRKREEISGEEWVKALNKLEPKKDIPITLSGGEPALHQDFIYIINNLKKELNIDILTNLYWDEKRFDKFIKNVDPNRLKRDSPYASIRASYHPSQMDIFKLVKNAKRLQDAGFSVGIWSVLYPSPEQLGKINEAQFVCKNEGIDFRLKEFVGIYKNEEYGNFSKYKNSAFQESSKDCLCRIKELIIGPNGSVYKCHRDLYAKENELIKIKDKNFNVEYKFRECNQYGQCHPCDVKVKTNFKQQLGHTSVEIKDIQD